MTHIIIITMLIMIMIIHIMIIMIMIATSIASYPCAPVRDGYCYNIIVITVLSLVI